MIALVAAYGVVFQISGPSGPELFTLLRCPPAISNRYAWALQLHPAPALFGKHSARRRIHSHERLSLGSGTRGLRNFQNFQIHRE